MRLHLIATLVVFVSACFASVIAGCASSKPATATELTRDPSEPAFRRVLSGRDERRIEGGFVNAASGHAAVQTPAAAGARGRWSDIPRAVVFACDAIEAAVVRQRTRPDGWEFAIRTVEDWPGTLIVLRTNDERLYEATASIGWMGDRTDRAVILLEALDVQMRAFGKKRKMPE